MYSVNDRPYLSKLINPFRPSVLNERHHLLLQFVPTGRKYF